MGSLIFIILGFLTIAIILGYDYRSKYKRAVKGYIGLKGKYQTVQSSYANLFKKNKETELALRETERRAVLAENELHNLKVQTAVPETPKQQIIKAGTASNVRKIFERELAKEDN